MREDLRERREGRRKRDEVGGGEIWKQEQRNREIKVDRERGSNNGDEDRVREERGKEEIYKGKRDRGKEWEERERKREEDRNIYEERVFVFVV